jgi:protection-of-telomeres protein 1
MAPQLDNGGGTPPQDTGLGLDIPKSITPMNKIVCEEINADKLVSVVGVVTDFRPPVATKGSGMEFPLAKTTSKDMSERPNAFWLIDFKAEMKLYDTSLQHSGKDFVFTIFRPREMIPNVEAGDVVCVESARVSGPNLSASVLHSLH